MEVKTVEVETEFQEAPTKIYIMVVARIFLNRKIARTTFQRRNELIACPPE
jgi:hypothetical protein